jgi:hypothetical protein
VSVTREIKEVGMPDDSENDVWKSIELIQVSIRERLFQMGMAGKLHTSRGLDIIKAKSANSTHVMPFDDESQEMEYLEALPRLIEQTTVQDAKCAELWDSREPRSLRDYRQQQIKLAELFLQYRFKLLSYERTVRQTDKPYLRQATQLLHERVTEGTAVRELESMLRLTLQEFVDLEGAIADDLRRLDETRAIIISNHKDFAKGMAESISGQHRESVQYALCGLTKATEHYLYWRGYGFRDYAAEWIETAIRERKTWGLNRFA